MSGYDKDGERARVREAVNMSSLPGTVGHLAREAYKTRVLKQQRTPRKWQVSAAMPEQRCLIARLEKREEKK